MTSSECTGGRRGRGALGGVEEGEPAVFGLAGWAALDDALAGVGDGVAGCLGGAFALALVSVVEPALAGGFFLLAIRTRLPPATRYPCRTHAHRREARQDGERARNGQNLAVEYAMRHLGRQRAGLFSSLSFL